ncbi:uncharacterized protein LOC128928299 isoform X6 [Callithrix jacchus]
MPAGDAGHHTIRGHCNGPIRQQGARAQHHEQEGPAAPGLFRFLRFCLPCVPGLWSCVLFSAYLGRGPLRVWSCVFFSTDPGVSFGGHRDGEAAFSLAPTLLALCSQSSVVSGVLGDTTRFVTTPGRVHERCR